MGAIVRPGAHTERACNTSYTLIARRMKMTCAALQAPRAHQRAHQRAHHFPKDVRYIRNGAHTILAWRAHHFGLARTPLLAWNQLGLPPIGQIQRLCRFVRMPW